jgi:hypothetical protein
VFKVAQMVKLLAAISGAAAVAGALVLLTAMTPISPEIIAIHPMVAASISPHAMIVETARKGDRLDIRSYGPGCDDHNWYSYEANCPKRADSGEVKRVHVITLDRMPFDVPLATYR